MTTPAPAIAPAEHLAARIARMQQLRAENAADYRPSFVAMLIQAEADAAARICPVFRTIVNGRRG